jgi:hypothetical protein
MKNFSVMISNRGVESMKLRILTSLALVLAAGPALAASQPLNDSECQKVWVTAVQSNDSLSALGTAPYIVVFKEVNANGDDQITKDEFSKGCAKGLVHEKSASN